MAARPFTPLVLQDEVGHLVNDYTTVINAGTGKGSFASPNSRFPRSILGRILGGFSVNVP